MSRAIDTDIQNIRDAVYGEEVRGSIIDALEQCYDDAVDVVKVSESQPTGENTKIWIKPTTDEYQVPTWEEHQELAGQVEDLERALSGEIQATLDEALSYELTIGSGVNPGTGGNYNNIARYSRTAMIEIPKDRSVAFAILDDTYEYVAWAYSAVNTGSATYSPTNEQYSSGWTLVPYSANDLYFRVGIQRKDHAAMTSGTEETTDESKLKKAIRVIYAPQAAKKDDFDTAIQNTKNTLNSAIQSALYENLEYALTMGGGVNPATGANVTGAGYARTSTVILQINRTIAVGILDDAYEFCAWGYTQNSTSSGTHSYTNDAYTQGWLFIPYTITDRQFRIGIRRVDGVDMTTGSNASTDESKLKAAIKILMLPNTAEDAFSVAQNSILLKAGGIYHPFLRQGRGNFSNTYYEETPNLFYATTPKQSPILLSKGDIVNSGSLKLYVSLVHITPDGIVRTKYANDVEPSYVVQETGLYLITVGNVDDTVPLSAITAMENVTITHKGSRSIYELPQNPYKHIATTKDSETGAYTWSSRIHDIKSTCHLHTIKALYFTRAKNSGYDHIAISNYHASKPTVPIAELITEMADYDSSRDVIPANWLESPNAEHVYFEDAADYVGSSAASHLHMCSVGSYITSGADNTGVGEGGFGGSVKEFSEEAERLLKYPNAGGLTINHPKWSGVNADGVINLLSLGNVFGMEIYNANCEHGQAGNGYALDLWDEVLSKGWQIFGTAVPDHETEGSFWSDHLPLGYVHLLCITNTEQEILLAYRNGRSYCTIANDTLLLKYFGIDNSGLVTFTASEAGTITFKTAKRSVVVSDAPTATFQTNDSDVYVRVEIVTETNRLFTNAIML